MNNTVLENLRDSLEKLEPIHQKRVFDILKTHKIEFTKNKNGVFVNMSLFDDIIVEKINNYLLYVKLQQKQLQQGEVDKEIYKKMFNDIPYALGNENVIIKSKDNKDNLCLES
jgi:hypothetical protein